jgi:hypothetical protein
MTLVSIAAYHGTSLKDANSIIASAYNESNKANEWLGHGVYFFVDGVSSPEENAVEWARAQAWDKYKRIHNYDQYAVLQSNISLDDDRLLDLTEVSGLAYFNTLKEAFLSHVFTHGTLAGRDEDEHNCMLFNFMMRKTGAQAVKHNLYIKSIRERKLNLRLHVPNTTVLCVIKDSVGSDNKIIKSGAVK